METARRARLDRDDDCQITHKAPFALIPNRTNRTLLGMKVKETQLTYGAQDARTRLPELLDKANRGLSSVITKRGKPYAALVPADQVNRTKCNLMALAGSGRGLWGKNSALTVRKLRDEWP